MDKANDVIGQIRSIWERFGASQRIGIVITVLVILAVALMLSFWAGSPDYRRLAYSKKTDASQIMSKLEEESIDYRVLPDGKTILVNSDQIDDATRVLARGGLLSKIEETESGGMFGGGRSPINRTEVRAMSARAAERRLAQSLESFDFITQARITVTPGTDHWLNRIRRVAKANVQISSPVVPSAAQIQSITHVITGGVDGLAADQVTISDMRGTVLKYADGEGGLANTEIQRVRQIESEKARKAQQLLDAVYGIGKTRVAVSADIDWSRSKKSELRYNPDSGVTTSRTKNEETRATARGRARGAPGSRASGGDENTVGNSESNSNLVERKRFDQTTTEILNMGGEISRLTAAVFIDESLQSETTKVEETIAAAIGIDTKRGDTIKVHVHEMSGVVAPEIDEPSAAMGFLTSYGGWIEKGLYAFLALLFLFFALRTLKKAQRSMRDVLERSLDEEEKVEVDPEPPPLEEIVTRSVREHSDLAGRNLRRWLYEPVEN